MGDELEMAIYAMCLEIELFKIEHGQACECVGVNSSRIKKELLQMQKNSVQNVHWPHMSPPTFNILVE